MSHTRIASDTLAAAISAHGAELVALEAKGTPLLWDGDPAWWAGRSPLLFPIVGRVPDDLITIEGHRYPLKQHGFARLSTFDLVAATAAHCRFRLTDSSGTRALYPFAFALTLDYDIAGNTLSVHARVENRETQRMMPFSFGFHPAFRWPLPPATGKEDHMLVFSHAEHAATARPLDGLLAPKRHPNLVGDSRRLALDDALFEEGALIFDTLASNTITYRNSRGASIEIGFDNLPHLGIWTKPGAPFVCVEPWHGYAAPLGFSGELADKPGVVRLAPGAAAEFIMRLTIEI